MIPRIKSTPAERAYRLLELQDLPRRDTKRVVKSNNTTSIIPIVIVTKHELTSN